MTSGPVAIVDIGSNSIKLLVAARAPAGNVVPLAMRTIDARISAGISRQQPQLSDEGMARGLDAVRSLLRDAGTHSPSRTILVATSAVRDAENGGLFRERVQAETGHDVRILTGDEEANLIGRGLTADLALCDLRDFHVFDLGGGSLECLAFRDRQIEQAISLRLGCVRLTEKFVGDPAAPIAHSVLAAVQEHTRAEIRQASFKFLDSVKSTAVGTGGTVTTVRAILGLQEGKALEATSTIVTVGQLQELLSRLAPLSLAERQKIPGLPSARADVFPVALATLIAVAELGGISAYRNSLFNLRYGLADEALPA